MEARDGVASDATMLGCNSERIERTVDLAVTLYESGPDATQKELKVIDLSRW